MLFLLKCIISPPHPYKIILIYARYLMGMCVYLILSLAVKETMPWFSESFWAPSRLSPALLQPACVSKLYVALAMSWNSSSWPRLEKSRTLFFNLISFFFVSPKSENETSSTCPVQRRFHEFLAPPNLIFCQRIKEKAYGTVLSIQCRPLTFRMNCSLMQSVSSFFIQKIINSRTLCTSHGTEWINLS